MIEFDNDDLKDAMNHLARAFAQASNGKVLKRNASTQLRKLLKPMVAKRRSAVLGLPSRSNSGMRQAIARQIRAATRWKGKNTGVSVIQRARGMPRDFQFAGRAFNREEGWNPVNLGGEVEHQQMTPVAWFDSQVESDRGPARSALVDALEETAAKIAGDIRRL